jgi:hypothetical protein
MNVACRVEQQKARTRSPPCLLIEAGASPRDVLVVHVVGDAEVAEAREEAALDRLFNVAAVDEVLAAQGKEVATVSALGRGGEAQQEARLEMVDQPPVGGGRGVVELVHHEVVELSGVEAAQMRLAAQGLHRGEEDIGLAVLLLGRIESEVRRRADAAKRLHRLAQDLFTVSHKEHPAELRSMAVEGG